MEKIYLSAQASLLTTIIVGLFFVGLGYINSKKTFNNRNYIIGSRDENVFSLTTSLAASALGAWILFGPASAATWGGLGAVIGYALGAATPMLLLFNFGPKIRKEFPRGLSLTEYIKKRFGLGILKISLFLILFYLIIFLIAEVTAISFLLNLISKTPLWITAGITLTICLLYILRGGFKLSILTDKYQFIIIAILVFVSVILILGNLEMNSLELIKKKSSNLISSDYLPNYTAGLTFFIAVAATNLFHQGNWQRVFAAKNDLILKKSLIYSFMIIFMIVFWMGYTGLISLSLNSKVTPDLAFFDLILSNNYLITISILILALTLTLSTIDTLINAISSIFIVNGKQINKQISGKFAKNKINYTVILICFLVFILASKGFSVLYLFLLADLFCCAAVVTIFYGFFNKKIDYRLPYFSILSALVSGLLFFPSMDFKSSILVGNLLPIEFFSSIITANLLFISFALAIIIQVLFIIFYSLRSSFK